MKPVSGKIVASSRPNLDEDWDLDECLCQNTAKIPQDVRIDYLVREFDEKRQKWRWKSKLRYHQDCPVHGCHRSE